MFRSLKLVIISLFLIVLCNSVFSLEINEQLIINGLNLNSPQNSSSTLFDSEIPARCVVRDISEDGLITCNLQADANVFVVSSSVMNIINDLGSPENNVKLKIEDNNATFFFLENRFLSKEGLTINIKELEIASGKFLQFRRGQSFSGQLSNTDNISVIRLISNIEKIKINPNARFDIFFYHFASLGRNLDTVLRNHYYLQSQGKPGYFFDDLATARNNPLYLGSDDIDFSNTEILILDNAKSAIYTNNSYATNPYFVMYSFILYTLNYEGTPVSYAYPNATNCPRDEYKFLTDISGEESETGTLPDHCDNGVLDGDEDFVDCGGSCDVCEDLSDALLLDTDFNISVKTCSGESDNCCATSSEVTKYFSLNLSLNGMIKFKSIENHGELIVMSYPERIITAYRFSDPTNLNAQYTHYTNTIFFFENYSGSNYPKILNNYNSNIVFFSTCSDQLTKLPNSYYNVCSFYNYSNNGNLNFNADGITGGLTNDKIFNFSRNTCNAIDLSSSTYTSYLNMANEKKVNPVLFGNISQIFPIQNIAPNLSNPKLLFYNNLLKRFQYNSNLLLKTTISQFKIYNQSEINSNYIGNNSIYAIDSNLSYENDLIRLIYPYKLYK